MKSVEIDRGKRLKDQPTTGHNRFHPDIPPVLTVEEGEEVSLATRDGIDGQLPPGTTEADMPGLMAFTRIPRGPSSLARVRVTASTAALLAL